MHFWILFNLFDVNQYALWSYLMESQTVKLYARMTFTPRWQRVTNTVICIFSTQRKNSIFYGKKISLKLLHSVWNRSKKSIKVVFVAKLTAIINFPTSHLWKTEYLTIFLRLFFCCGLLSLFVCCYKPITSFCLFKSRVINP